MTNYQCERCGAQIKNANTPTTRGCPKGGDHNWNNLGRATPKTKKEKDADKRGELIVGVIIAASITISIAIKVLKFLYFTILNIFSILTIANYNFDTYLNNIKTAHQNSYIITTSPQIIYKKNTKLIDINNKEYILTNVLDGQLLQNKGYITKTGSSWIAVLYYEENKKQYGYLHIPYKIDTSYGKIDSIKDHFISDNSTNDVVKNKINEIKAQNRDLLIQELNVLRLDFYIANDSIELQQFEESENYKDFVNIDEYSSWGNFQTFLNKKDMKKFKSVYKKYMNENKLLTIM